MAQGGGGRRRDGHGIDADVRSEADVQRLVDAAVDAYGRIDVMWANAGFRNQASA